MSQLTATTGKRIVVLGGGISGLSFLHYLRVFASAFNKDHLIDEIILVEANDYLGGSIKSKVYEDGVVHEMGSKSIRSQGLKSKSTITLVEHLGLHKNAQLLHAKSVKRRLIYTKDGKIEYIPASSTKFFSRLPGTKTLLCQAIIRDLFRAQKMDLTKYPDQDPPLYDFVGHRFGQEVAEHILDPVMRGVSAGNARILSTRALVSEFLDQEQAYGSVIRGMMKAPIKKLSYDELYASDILNSEFVNKMDREKIVAYTFPNGLSDLPERLGNSLINNNPGNKVCIYNQTKALSIEFENDNDEDKLCSVIVETVDGDRVKINADHVVSALPSIDFVKLYKATLPSNRRTIWEDIVDVAHSPVGVVNVEYSNPKLKERLDLQSTGLLTHSKSDARVLSVSYDSISYPDKDPGVFKLNVMIGGDWFNSVFGEKEIDLVRSAELEDTALSDIRRIIKISDEPLRITTHLWKTGIAQYRPGHSERIERLRSNIERLRIPLTLIGQSYDGVGINDVVFGARSAANDFIKNLCDT